MHHFTEWNQSCPLPEKQGLQYNECVFKEDKKGKTMILYIALSLLILCIGIYLARGKKNDFKALSLIMTVTISFAISALVVPYFAAKSPNLLFLTLSSIRYGSQCIGMNVNSEIVEALNLSQPVKTLYACYLYTLYLAGPIFASMFLISFSSTLIEMLRFSRYKNVYIFSELNERSIVIAESLFKDYRHSLRVFCNSDNAPEALKTRARACHALFLKRDESKIHLHKGRIYEFFEIDSDAEKTLNGTTELAGMLMKHKNLLTDITVRAFVHHSQIEMIRDFDSMLSETCPGLKVRFVDDAQSEAVEVLHSLMARLPIGEKGHHFHIMIVGCGVGGSAMLRTSTWLFCLPESACTIHVFDKSAKLAASRIREESPEFLNAPLERYFSNDPAGKNYDIVFHEAAAESEAFLREAEALPEMDLVIVSLGDDSLNHTVVRMLQRVFAKKNDTLRIPLTAARIRNENFAKLIRLDETTVYYGSIRKHYSYTHLIHPDLDAAARKCHKAYSGNTFWTEQDELDFCRYVNHDSSFAQALTTVARKQYILHSRPEGVSDADWIRKTLNDEKELARLGDAEHDRWNAYQRVNGWRRASLEQAEEIARRTNGRKVKDDRLLLHPAIVPVPELPFVEERVDEIRRKYNPEAGPCRYVQVDRDIIRKLPEILS